MHHICNTAGDPKKYEKNVFWINESIKTVEKIPSVSCYCEQYKYLVIRSQYGIIIFVVEKGVTLFGPPFVSRWSVVRLVLVSDSSQRLSQTDSRRNAAAAAVCMRRIMRLAICRRIACSFLLTSLCIAPPATATETRCSPGSRPATVNSSVATSS